VHPRALIQRFEFGSTDDDAACYGTHRALQGAHARSERGHRHHRRVGCIPRGGLFLLPAFALSAKSIL